MVKYDNKLSFNYYYTDNTLVLSLRFVFRSQGSVLLDVTTKVIDLIK